MGGSPPAMRRGLPRRCRVKPWCTVSSASAATCAAARSGEPSRPMAKLCRRGHQASPFVVVLHPLARELRGAGGHQRRIQPARQQHAVGHVAHQLAMHRALERIAQLRLACGHALHRAVVAPGALVTARERPGRTVVDMAGGNAATSSQTRTRPSSPRPPTGRPSASWSPVQRADAHVVARDQDASAAASHNAKAKMPLSRPSQVSGASPSRCRALITSQSTPSGTRRAWRGGARARDGCRSRHSPPAPARRPGMDRLRTPPAGSTMARRSCTSSARPPRARCSSRAAMALARRQRERQRAQRMQVGAGAQVEDTEDRTSWKSLRGSGGRAESPHSQCGLREDQRVMRARIADPRGLALLRLFRAAHAAVIAAILPQRLPSGKRPFLMQPSAACPSRPWGIPMRR